MGFLQPDKPDIFVSYAHVNDIALTRGRPGWVSAFVSGLKNLLAMKLGRDDVFDLWMDHRLAGNQSVTPEIDRAAWWDFAVANLPFARLPGLDMVPVRNEYVSPRGRAPEARRPADLCRRI